MAKLTIVGSGIKLMAHITAESESWIKQADIVFYMGNNKLTPKWMHSLNSNCQDLGIHYAKGRDRQITYDAMVNQVLEALQKRNHVCVVFYGHPTVFVSPAPDMIRRAQAHGHSAEMLPGTSAEDCLFADLALDPARHGCQTYEATDFLTRPRVWDIHSGLILWQVGVIGHMTAPNEPINPIGIELLAKRLLLYYPANHLVTIYEAAILAILEPRIDQIQLNQLDTATVTQISTLYIPPIQSARVDQEILMQLGLK